MKRIETLLGSLVVSGAWLLASPSQALAACPGGSDGPSVNISRTFASGARWSFDVQVTQSLPFMNFANAQWEMLLGVRNLFRDVVDEASMYDELLVVRPPKRIVGGLTLRF